MTLRLRGEPQDGRRRSASPSPTRSCSRSPRSSSREPRRCSARSASTRTPTRRSSAGSAARGWQLTCPACGPTLSAGQKFCGECGAAGRWRRPHRRQPAACPRPKPTRPKHLAERILTSRAALEGERKQVTVLFADLKGSMELLADRDPEEARAHPRPGARTDDGGGPPLRGHGQPGHGRRHHGAVRRAARPRGPRRPRLLRRAAHAGERSSSTPRRCGATAGRAASRSASGLNSGEVVVRSIGSDLRMDYTAVGQTTHLAARMEQLAAARLDPARARHACGWPRATCR